MKNQANNNNISTAKLVVTAVVMAVLGFSAVRLIHSRAHTDSPKANNAGCSIDHGTQKLSVGIGGDDNSGGYLNTGRFMVMGTYGQVQLRCRNKQAGMQAIKRAREALDRIDLLLSTYRDDSEIARVNRQAASKPVQISATTWQLLKKALYYSSISEGAFDITVTPLIRLWKRAGRQDKLPTKQEIARARALVGYKNVVLSTSANGTCTIRFLKQGVVLNVDAIAKGYAVDAALNALKGAGILAGMVEIGGEIACFGGEKPGWDYWLIGIQDPFASDNDNQLSLEPRWKIRLSNCAIATSGNYRRYVVIGNHHYSHIIDPATGWPAQKLPSVSVIAPTDADADALATAISVMGVQKGIALAERLTNVEAMVVSGDANKYSVHYTTGWAKYESKLSVTP